MFQYTLRDESNHIALGRYLIEKLVEENPEIWTPEFQDALFLFMRDGVIFLKKEKNFFETRVTEYQTGGSLQNTAEEDLV
jgi:ribonucleotide reductase beta subunit family protein with ferritin-like domain